MSRTTPARPERLALTGAVLFGAGLVGGNALTQAATVSTGLWDERIEAPGTYRLASIGAVLAAVGALLLVAASTRALADVGARLVATAAGSAAAGALLLLAGVRYAAPDVPTGGSVSAPSAAVAAAASACAFAAFVALGIALLAAPGPDGGVRVGGRVAGGVCALGPLVAAVVSAADPGAGFGVAVASTALAVLLVVGWGLGLSLVGGAGEPEVRREG